jgi:hypothetical protein
MFEWCEILVLHWIKTFAKCVKLKSDLVALHCDRLLPKLYKDLKTALSTNLQPVHSQIHDLELAEIHNFDLLIGKCTHGHLNDVISCSNQLWPLGDVELESMSESRNVMGGCF